MATHRLQGTDGGLFYCTSTCWDWLPLIQETSLYDHLYAWLSLMHDKGCRVVGYVFMPNHLHLMLFVPELLSINAVLGNMKRFAAYEIIKRLKDSDRADLLVRLRSGQTAGTLARSQHHRVWRTSSDIKLCHSALFTQQKLNYIHGNPVQGKWALADHAAAFKYSSASFHMEGRENESVRLYRVDEVGTASGVHCIRP